MKNYNEFDDNETWSLDQTIAKFILPRLKRYRDINFSPPLGLTDDEWNDILNRMIVSFGIAADDSRYSKMNKDELKIFEDGFEQFHKYFKELYW